MKIEREKREAAGLLRGAAAGHDHRVEPFLHMVEGGHQRRADARALPVFPLHAGGAAASALCRKKAQVYHKGRAQDRLYHGMYFLCRYDIPDGGPGDDDTVEQQLHHDLICGAGALCRLGHDEEKAG